MLTKQRLALKQGRGTRGPCLPTVRRQNTSHVSVLYSLPTPSGVTGRRGPKRTRPLQCSLV